MILHPEERLWSWRMQFVRNLSSAGSSEFRGSINTKYQCEIFHSIYPAIRYHHFSAFHVLNQSTLTKLCGKSCELKQYPGVVTHP